MANEFDWLDELPDYGAEQVLENEQEHAEKTAPAPLPIPQMAGPSPEQRREELNAFLLSGRYEDAEVQERLRRNPELEDLSANVRRLDALNARAVQGQTVLRYAFPELEQEPGAYFLKRNKPLPECQTRTDAFAAVYDDYMAEVEGEYKQLLERRAAWQANKEAVSQAAADVVAGRVSPAQLAERLSPEQHAVYTKEFDPVATEKAGVAMGLLRDAFAGTAEEGLKQMVDQGLANGVVAALSDADEESGELVLNEKAVGMFQGALFSLMKEAKEKSGDEYKFLHNMLLALGNPVKRRKKDIQGVLGMMVQADTAAALAMAGDDAASQAVQHELGENIEEMRTRWKNDAVYARMRGMLDAAQGAGNETAEAADFFAKTVNALGSVIGQTAPFFVPYVGTGVALVEAYDEKRNAAYFKGLKEGTAEWSAFIDAATSVAVEKIAFGGWSRFSATGRILEKIPGYGKVRNTLLGSFYARAALEVGAGVLEESALEPTAEALLQWGLRNGVLRWADVGGRYDWSEYAAELKAMFRPEQLAATVIFGAGLSGVQSPMIKAAAEGYSKHVEHLMAQGIGQEEARNIAAMPDAGERVDAAIKARAEAWKDPQAAEANRLMAATMFREIEEARAMYESRAYQEARRELNLPKVEKVIDKEGRYLVTTFDRVDGHELFHGEVGEQQLLEMLGHYIQQEERMRIHRAQSAMGANALLRAAEKSGEVVVEDMADAKNPESGEQVISEAGAMGLEEFKYAAELALDEMEARMASGMSEQEALATPFAALSRYMPLGHWLQLERAFQERLATARETTGEEGADSTRVLNVTPAAGTTKADTLLLAARGQVETREVLEDVIEHAQKKVTGNDPAKLRAWHALLRDAQKAVKQLGFKLNFYDGHDGLDAATLQGKVTEGMSKLASAYTVVNADALPLPAWVKDLVKWHMRALEDAAAIVELAEAYRTGRERGNISQDIEDVLAEIGHKAASLFQSAELEAVDVQAYKDARARYRMLTGDMTPTASEVQAEQDAADAREQERVRPAEDVKSVLPPREDGSMDEQTFSPAGDLPEEVRAAFPKGACYNIGARAWLGMVPVARLHLSPDAPQVKVGSNKKGVVNPLVGDYRQDAPPVYVWQRRNGTLEVISGRHRLDLAKRTNTEMIAAYVYPEDAAHDAKWARLLDFEQNMQDDQADELTAAIYVRETQLSDEELTRRGLTRGGSKSARGILIGREAREDLWSRFQSRAIDPRTAEAVCKLTMYMPDKSRIDAMQAMAAADLAKGKSLEHVAAKLQLMAHADADGEATQGLLSFGESFDEALERSAAFIARSIEVINTHIAAVTKARSLGKGGVSEQEGISVGLDMDPKQRLAELNELKAAYEKCGFHEKIRFRALTWDGKSDVDPIGDYARDKAAAAELAGPTAEELEQQARDAAAEATGTFGFSTYTTRQLSRAYATDAAGNKLASDTFITTPLGNLDWYIFPQDEKTQKLLAARGIKNLPIRLTVGKQTNQAHRGFGLIHMLNHFDDYATVGETPLLHLYNTLFNLVKIRGGAFGRYNFKGEYEGKDSKLVAQLLEEDGYYSIITSYPEQMDRRPQAGELVIGRVLFQFPSNSGKNQIHVSKSQSNAVTASVSTNGQASAGNVAQAPAQVNIYDVRIKDSSGNLIFQQPVEPKANFSVTSMSEAAQGLLEGSAMKVTRAADLIKDFNAQIANWNRVATSKEGRTDARTGAEMFGTVQALLSSARKVLPDGYRGNVHTMMQWASVYAGMAETGQLPAAGALKGNAKILDAFRKKMLNETAMAADNAEAEAMLASIGEQKLNEVMVKVLQQVRGQLAKFAKDELWAKMGKVIQHAKAKEEQGKKSKRGKMSEVDYEKLARYEQYLAMDAETVREELDGLYGKLDKAEGDRAAKLEEEAGELSLYGGWKGMSLQQAVAAYQAMVLFCATGRSNWQRVLDKRKAEIEFLAREMGRELPTDRTASETRLAEHTNLRKALRRLPYGCMSYSQLMLALSSRLGEGFCFDRIQEMTDANAALLNAEKSRMGWMYELVQKVSGRKGELACEKWLADFDTPHDTGIVLSPMAWCEVEMTVEAAEDWLALGKEEREKQWAEREADEKRKKRNLRRERPMVPEALLPELRKAVKEYKENPRKSSGKVTVRGEYEDKGRARTLTCSRDGALYAILLHEQSDYQTVFGRPGEVMEAGLLYREGLNTPEKIRQLYDYVGPAGLRYGYALREKLHEQGLTVAQVFEAREGIPFKFRDNYFRASFDRLAVKEKNTVTDGKVNSMGGGKYGMLINRVAHHQEAAKWDMGASMVFLAASLEQDNYIFTSHITDRWRKLLLQREFATKLKAYLGDDVMNKLVCWLEVIDNAPLDNMRAFSNLSHWQGFFRGAWAASVLNGNGYVLMKQASALLHGYFSGYVPEAIKEQEDGVREVAHRHIGFLEFLGNAVAGGPISDKDLENSPYFQARRTAVGKGVSTQGLMDAGRKRSALALPSEKLGEQIEKLDAWLNLKTARAMANAFYAASKKLNEQHGGLLTEEQLREGALQAVGRMLELGAQPQTRTQKSIFQNGSGMLGKMTFAMKSESINKLGLWLAQLTRGERMSPLGLWLSSGIAASIVNYLAEWLQGGDDDDEYVLKNHLVSAAVSIVAGPLSAVPLVSEGIADLSSMITGERVYSSNLSKQLWDVGGAFRGVKKLYKHHSGDKEMTWEQYFHTIIALLRISGAGFGAFSRSGSEALSSFGSLALSAAAGANVSRAGKDILCTVGLLDRPKKKESAKSRTKSKAGQRTKRKK